MRFHHHYVFLYQPKEISFRILHIHINILTLKLYTYPVRNRLDSLGPNSLVELGVETNVGRAHSFLSKVDNGFDGPRSTLFEGTAMHAFMEVDSVFAGDDVLQRRASLAASLNIGIDALDLGVVQDGDSVPFSWCSRGPTCTCEYYSLDNGRYSDAPCLEDVSVDEQIDRCLVGVV